MRNGGAAAPQEGRAHAADAPPEAEAAYSVALCTRDGTAFLAAQLVSLLSQTLLPTEVVAVDDGSSDATPALLEAFRADAEALGVPVRLERNAERLGAARSFFRAIRLCREEIVILCDQDDIWTPDRGAAFARAVRATPGAVAWMSDGVLIPSDGPGSPGGPGSAPRRPTRTLWGALRLGRRARRLVDAGRAAALLARKDYLTGSAMAVRRSFAAALPDPVPPFYHDAWIGWFASGRLALFPDRTYAYRQHPAQATGLDPSAAGSLRRVATGPRGTSRAAALDAAAEGFSVLARLLRESAASSVEERADAGAADLAVRKAAFLRNRARVARRAAPVRIAGVLGAACRGRYRAFGGGWRTAAKDLFGRGAP